MNHIYSQHVIEKKEKVLGLKGTNKRKSRQIKRTSVTTVSDNSSVQSLIKEKGAPIQGNNTKASGRWNKKKKKY